MAHWLLLLALHPDAMAQSAVHRTGAALGETLALSRWRRDVDDAGRSDPPACEARGCATAKKGGSLLPAPRFTSRIDRQHSALPACRTSLRTSRESGAVASG